MKRVVIVQARMTSTRLPGKILRPLAGRPMLAQQLRRLRECRDVDEIVVATTVNGTDDPVAELAAKEGVGLFRGDEHDVLKRYAEAAERCEADVVVRVTADCPLIDPALTDQVIRALVKHPTGCDYASNVLKRSYPRGLDVEAFHADVLRRIHRLATSASAREHVTLFARQERPELFVLCPVVDTEDHSDLRWTVDTEVDFEVIRRTYEDLDLSSRVLPYRAILDYARAHPDLFRKNAHLNAGMKG